MKTVKSIIVASKVTILPFHFSKCFFESQTGYQEQETDVGKDCVPAMDIYRRLTELEIQLPPLPPLAGIFQRVKQIGNLLYVSGQGPTENGIPLVTGKVGKERTIEEGQYAARACVLNALSVLHDYLGDLNQIKSVVKLLAFVASAEGFGRQPEVANGASQLLLDIFGPERGVGARSAIGTNELPDNITAEIEFIFELY